MIEHYSDRPAPRRRTRVVVRRAALLAGIALIASGGTRLSAQQVPPAVANQAAQNGPVVLGSVEVRGNERLEEATVRGTTGLVEGDTIDYRDIQRAIRRLWSTGQFSDVKVYADGSEQEPTAPVSLIVEVAEQPYIAAIEFNGLTHVDAGTVRDTVGLDAGTPLRPSTVSRAKSMVRELLADEGIRLRSVDHRIVEVAGRPGEHRLVFDVEEGNRVAIAEVDFVGNEVFGDDQLRGAIDTKEEGFFWFRSGTYDEELLRADLRQALPAFYGSHGYIDFAVTGDTLIVDPQSGKAHLVIEVSEGEQYRLADFDVEGNRRFPSEQLRRYFSPDQGGLLSRIGFGGGETAEEGAVFDRAAFQAATDQVYQLYRNNGYLYAQVEPVVERVEGENGDRAVRVAWSIVENDPAYINRVDIEGNTYTHERVIRDQIFVLPGQVYNEQALIQSYQNVMALGFFETPMPMPRIEPTEDGDVNITFEVVEQQTGSINFGTAIGGASGVAGFLGYDQPNLFGQAKSGHLRWEFGRWNNNFEASYSDPAISNSLVSGTVSLFRTSGAGRYFRFSEGEYKRTGASLRFGLPLPMGDRRTRLIMGYSLSRTDYNPFGDGASTIFRLPPGVQSTATLGLLRSTLNHPLFPTQGTRQELEANFTGGLLGGDGQFQKYTATGTWYVPVAELGGEQPGSSPIRFTLGLTAEAGALIGDASRFPFDRFWMGGVQFGQPLRGYEETTITPFGYIPKGGGLANRFGDAYLRLSAEYAVRLNNNISLSLFYDAGNVWRDPIEVNPTQLFRGAGVGLTLVTPFGPLGLDYAYGFDKTDDDGNPAPGWQLHFKFGPAF